MKFKISMMILLLVILKAMHAAEPVNPCPDELEHIELQIRCFPPELTTQKVQDTTIETNPSTKIEAVMTDTGTTQTLPDTTFEDKRSTKKKTVTKTNRENPMTNSYLTMKIKKKIKKDMISDLYVYIGAAARVPLLLLIGLIIVCIRKCSHQPYQTKNQYKISMKTHSDNIESNNDYDELNGEYITLKMKSSNTENDKDTSQSPSDPVI